jgi:hypothetical protein
MAKIEPTEVRHAWAIVRAVPRRKTRREPP